MKGFSECQPFLVHLKAEHKRLETVTCEIETALVECTNRVYSPAVIGKVSRLRDELVAHFEEEKRGGCLEEALSRCPRLSEEALIIDREHVELIQQLNQLIEQTEVSRSLPDESFASDFRRFAQGLRRHEARESRILMEAFGCGDE